MTALEDFDEDGAPDIRPKRLGGPDAKGVAVNRPIEYARIWKGKGPRAFHGEKWQEAECWNGAEAAALSVFVAHHDWGKRIEGLSLEYIAGKMRRCKRMAIYAINVLVKSGCLIRHGTPRGAKEINGYDLVPERLAYWATQRRPADWDPPSRARRSVSATHAPGTVHTEAVKAAVAAAGLASDDPMVVVALQRAAKADRGAFMAIQRAERARDTAAKAEAVAAEVGMLVAGLAARPAAPASATTAPTLVPAPGLIPPVVMGTPVRPAAAAASPSSSAARAPHGSQQLAFPLARALSIAELAAQRPEDELLGLLVRTAAKGKSWALGTADRVLRRMEQNLTEPERQTLRDIQKQQQQEEERDHTGPSGRATSLQALPGQFGKII